MTLKEFIKRIPNFSTMSSATQIDYFVYYLQFEMSLQGVKPKDIEECFSELHLSPYSNISAYLNKFSLKTKYQKFLKRGGVYYLESSTISRIEEIVQKEVEPDVTDNLFPQTIFDNTRGYLVEFTKEASLAYDYKLYNSCFFMLRKILETLIIELFERRSIESKIRNTSGGYLFLSDLITKLVAEPTWHLTKIVREDIPKIKKLADSSVHSKRFSAKKPDIEKIKTEIRIILQELVSLIDYPTWNN